MAENFDWLEKLEGMNGELEERILEANADKSLAKWNKLIPELMAADVLIVGQYSGKKDENGVPGLNILMMQREGQVVIPCFTSPERIKAMSALGSSTLDVLRVNMVRFLESLDGRPAVMNPLTKYTRVFNPFEAKILAAEHADKAPPLPASDEKPV